MPQTFLATSLPTNRLGPMEQASKEHTSGPIKTARALKTKVIMVFSSQEQARVYVLNLNKLPFC